MGNEILKFIEEWNSTHPAGLGRGIRMMPSAYDGDIYGISIRFSAQQYDCSEESFAEMKNAICRTTGGTALVSTGYREFKNGILGVMIAFCNHGYSPKKIRAMLELLTGEILPSFRKISLNS